MTSVIVHLAILYVAVGLIVGLAAVAAVRRWGRLSAHTAIGLLLSVAATWPIFVALVVIDVLTGLLSYVRWWAHHRRGRGG